MRRADFPYDRVMAKVCLVHLGRSAVVRESIAPLLEGLRGAGHEVLEFDGRWRDGRGEVASFEAWIGADRLHRFNAACSALFYALGLQDQTDASLHAGGSKRRHHADRALAHSKRSPDALVDGVR